MVDERSGTMAVDGSAADEAVASLPFAKGGMAAALAGITPLVIAASSEGDSPEGAAPVTSSSALVPFRLGDAWHLTVVSKLAFSVQRGASGARLIAAPAPEPIRPRDQHHKNQPLGRVVAPNDRAPYKARVDVTLVGHAHAPGGAPVRSMNVRFALAQHGATPIDKTLRVVGVRSADDAPPAPFTTMAIGYDRAFGGVETPANPIGVGEDPEDEERPTVLDPREPRRPAGFGPLAAAWPARSRQLGGVSRKQVETAVPELPLSFDWGYYQCAPADQRLALLAPDARLLLEGLDPDFPSIDLTLPEARLVGAIYGLDRSRPDEGVPLVFHADGLHIDTDRWVCEIIGRAVVQLPEGVDPRALAVVVGGGVAGVAPPLPARRPSGAVAVDADAGEPRRRAATVLWEQAAKAGTLAVPEDSPSPISLPFHAPGSPAPAATALAAAPAPAPSAAFVPAPMASPPIGFAKADDAVPSSPWARSAMRARGVPVGEGSRASTAASWSATTAAAPRSAAGPPPPGSLATAVPAPVAAPEVTLEVHAAIAAELDEPEARRAAVLSRRGIPAADHARAAREWRDTLRRELRSGRHELRDRFDDAWVAAWEDLHPDLFTLEDHARLELAERRGTLLVQVEELGLEPAVALRLRRVWRRRVQRDAGLRAQLEAHLAQSA